MVNTLLDLSALHFLIVDDSARMRELITGLLQSLGAQNFHEAGDGGEAFEILKSQHVDIILTDWMMEPVDGIEFTRNMRTAPDSPMPMIPIIMITAHTEAQRVTEARDAGVTEFLAKPISPATLYGRIEEVILRPRQFIRTEMYTGPDRHRRSDEFYTGPRRRNQDEDNESASGESEETAAPTPAQSDSEA